MVGLKDLFDFVIFPSYHVNDILCLHCIVSITGFISDLFSVDLGFTRVCFISIFSLYVPQEEPYGDESYTQMDVIFATTKNKVAVKAIKSIFSKTMNGRIYAK